MKYVKPIDPHVHLRGDEYKEIGYLGRGFKDAEAVGLCAVLEMPNPVPQLTNQKECEDRLMRPATGQKVFHGINIGLTNDMEQVEKALELLQLGFKTITADKVFYTHSTGNMGILDEDVQKEIWELKNRVRYTGVSMGHFEDEKVFAGEFDPENPVSHTFYQNAQAELVQVERQLRNAVDTGFQGTFYVCHISNPLTISVLEQEMKKNRTFKIVREVTFHHMFLNYMDYNEQGNRVKMNPPIRSRDRQEALLDAVLNGRVEVIGTDHAPHPVDKKDSNNPPSGIPALPFWPRGIELLRENGISEERLEDITFNNANRIFDLGLQKEYVEVEYDPSMWEFYGYNPFIRL